MADERKVEELNQEAETGCEAPESEAAQAEGAAETSCEEEALEEESGQEQQEDAQAAEDDADAGREKKGFFSKKKDKKEEGYKAQIAELQDKVMRQMAEFENFRKRTEKEKSAMFETGAKSVIEKILPVVDNFERGLKSIPEEEQGGPVASGMEMIYKQLMAVLTDLGVTPIDAVGQEFDPEFHNAVMHVEDGELGENVIAEEFQKGYKYKDAVLRHSMVKVAN